MKVTLTYDFKYRNWTCACLYPFEAGKRESMRWKMSSLCNWLHWHSQETNWKILHFKTACPAPFNAKADLSSTHTQCDLVHTSRGHTYLFAAHALCHTQHVYSNCESLMHVSVQVCMSLMCEKRREQERQRVPEGIHSESVNVEPFTSELHSHSQFNCGNQAHTYSSLQLSECFRWMWMSSWWLV